MASSSNCTEELTILGVAQKKEMKQMDFFDQSKQLPIHYTVTGRYWSCERYFPHYRIPWLATFEWWACYLALKPGDEQIRKLSPCIPPFILFYFHNHSNRVPESQWIVWKFSWAATPTQKEMFQQICSHAVWIYSKRRYSRAKQYVLLLSCALIVNMFCHSLDN